MEAAAAMAAYFLVLWAGDWHYGEVLAGADPLYRQATAACLSAIVVTQIANVFLCRSAREPFWRLPHGPNSLILIGIAVEVAAIVAIDYVPLGNDLFGTAPLPAGIWGLALFSAGHARNGGNQKGAPAPTGWQSTCFSRLKDIAL
jgi:sodium/potassium-transporting ATPase subunit alpha